MVYIYCVNDGAVMTAWKKHMGLAGSDMIEFLADTDASLTDALGLVLTGDGKPYGAKEGPNNALGFHTKRCKVPMRADRTRVTVATSSAHCFTLAHAFDSTRAYHRQRSAMYVVDGVVKVMQVSEAEDDPAGDARPESSCVENMLKLIAEL